MANNKEITIQPSLNQYEAINRAAEIKLWAHELLEGQIQPSIISLDTLLQAIALHLGDQQQAPGAMVGEIKLWPAAAAPDGWLLCQGQAISRAEHAELFALLGETYGAGDGATTFHLPDLRGRAAVGAGQGAGLSDRGLGSSFGTESHALSAAEGPSHSHAGPSHAHTMAHTHTGGAHTHGLVGNSATSGPAWQISFCSSAAPVATTTQSGGGVATSGASTSTTGSAGTGATNSSGSGAAHNNMQPSLSINFIIYAGVQS